MSSIVLLHGALGAASQFAELSQRLNANGTQVYPLNFSGHGGADFSNNGFGIEVFAEELKNFLDEHALKNIDVFAYSMGGYVALWLAHQHPAYFKRIITLGTKFDWSPEAAAKEVKLLNPEKLLEKIPAFAKTLQERHEPNDWKLLMQKTADMMLALGEKPLLTETVLKQIDIPVLVCQGELDNMADMNYTKQVASFLPNGKFLMMKSSPHPFEKINLKTILEIIRSNMYKGL
ncbi:MAG TPA: alpha/beta fold hydrolase [Cyclobacteriaceae bacterium]|nr:alpha/beta fold hydrolase [Cyclobacteriaceae bacterium]